MNNQEAIARLQVGMHIKKEEIKNNKVFFPKHDNSRLEEDIEAYETAISAIEKQISKKPKDELKIKPVIDKNGAYVDADVTVYLVCPNCGEMVGIDDMCDRFCRECGQAIDWSESD